MRLFLSAPPALSVPGSSEQVGVWAVMLRKALQTVLCGSFCSKSSFQHLAGAKPVRLVQARGNHHPKDWSHHNPPPHTGRLGTASEGHSVTSCDTILSTRSLRGQVSKSRPRIFSEYWVKASTYSSPGSNQEQGFIPQTLLKTNSGLPRGCELRPALGTFLIRNKRICACMDTAGRPPP